ncbi:MAG: hydroxymethylbilane synthase, partial [Candidatus Bathyarchaeia archaeon]
MRLVVGTRGSLLSLKQTDIVIEKLRGIYPDVRFQKKIIKTRGDLLENKPLFSMRGKGFFEKEVDRAVSLGEVDFAVHSMKDVPTVQPPKTGIVAVPERESPHDVLASRGDVGLMGLPKGSTVGTSSLRRMAQILRARSELKVKPIRGNVETRVRKLEEGLFDAVILAEVGLKRLGIGCAVERLPLDEFTPAPGQGALAVVAREDNSELVGMLRKVN